MKQDFLPRIKKTPSADQYFSLLLWFFLSFNLIWRFWWESGNNLGLLDQAHFSLSARWCNCDPAFLKSAFLRWLFCRGKSGFRMWGCEVGLSWHRRQDKPFALYTPSTDSPHTRARTTEMIRSEECKENENRRMERGEEGKRTPGCWWSLPLWVWKSFPVSRWHCWGSPLDSAGSSQQGHHIH